MEGLEDEITTLSETESARKLLRAQNPLQLFMDSYEVNVLRPRAQRNEAIHTEHLRREQEKIRELDAARPTAQHRLRLVCRTY
jgi:hypothetical protein